MFRPADNEPGRPNIDLTLQLRDRGRRGSSRVNAPSTNDAVQDRRNADLTVGDDGDDVFVWSIGADSVLGAERVRDFLGKGFETAFCELVVRGCGFPVED